MALAGNRSIGYSLPNADLLQTFEGMRHAAQRHETRPVGFAQEELLVV
jgi:hypothetical protein